MLRQARQTKAMCVEMHAIIHQKRRAEPALEPRSLRLEVHVSIAWAIMALTLLF